MLLLNNLRSVYQLPESLYREIRDAIKFNAAHNDAYLDDFIKDLPVSLRNEFMLCVHNRVINKFGFFRSLGSKIFVSWVCSQLKPRISSPGNRLY